MVLPAVLLVAGCGSSSPNASSSGDQSGSDTTETTPPTAVATTLSPADQAVLDQINQRGKPVVTVPAAPVTTLGITDDVVGTGATVTSGSTVTVHYVGVSQSTGKEFDSSWSRGQTISFPLSGVIKGWTDGLVGMKVGGRRTLVIPGDQAYGASPPSGSGIGPNDTLVFVIDLVSTT
jgi:peptidylprolyl isomerase